MSVLLLGIPCAEIELLQSALESRGASVTVMSPRDPLELRVEGGSASWWLDGECLPAYESAYNRLVDLSPNVPLVSPAWTPESMMANAFYRSEVTGLKASLLLDTEACGARMYNGIGSESLESKPARLARLARAGIPVPTTLMTQLSSSVLEFLGENPRAVYKPCVGSTAVKMFRPEVDEARLALLDTAPVAFQRFEDGIDVRVYVCDGKPIAGFEIGTDSEVDYRDSNWQAQEIAIDAELAAIALQATAISNIRFSAVDLRRREADYFVLEVNNCPMFAIFDSLCGGRIASVLAEQMANGS